MLILSRKNIGTGNDKTESIQNNMILPYYYHSAQIKRTVFQREFSLSFQMIKMKIITPFEAPENLLEIKSNQRSAARFV